MGQGIEACQARTTARCGEVCLEAVIDDIPWWGCGMYIIDDETHKIDHQESPAHTQGSVDASLTSQPKGIAHRDRQPAQIAETCNQIEQRMIVVLEVGSGNHLRRSVHYAEKLQLEIVKRLQINRTDVVVGIQA